MPTSVAGFWELDEPPVPATRRALRAAAVGATWLVAALPALLGHPRCLVAAFLHRPCPGCGLTRSILLLAAGDARASLGMHPLAVPIVVVGLSFAAVTVTATLELGSPLRMHRVRSGRAVIAAAVVVYAAAIALWTLREFSLFGGPVPV